MMVQKVSSFHFTLDALYWGHQSWPWIVERGRIFPIQIHVGKGESFCV